MLCVWGALLQSSKYYKGGFEPKMTKREASLILGVRYVISVFKLIHIFCGFKKIVNVVCIYVTFASSFKSY